MDRTSLLFIKDIIHSDLTHTKIQKDGAKLKDAFSSCKAAERPDCRNGEEPQILNFSLANSPLPNWQSPAAPLLLSRPDGQAVHALGNGELADSDKKFGIRHVVG